jgi:hypothetical protein
MLSKISGIKKPLGQRPNSNGQKLAGQRKFCKLCEKDGHTEEKFLQ